MNPTGTWSARNIYLYLVCLITLVMFIFATVNLVRAAVELFYPEPEPVPYYSVPAIKEGETPPQPDEMQIEAQRESMRRSTVRRAVLSLVGSGTMLLLAVPIYLYHWRKIERETHARESEH